MPKERSAKPDAVELNHQAMQAMPKPDAVELEHQAQCNVALSPMQ